MGRGTEQTLFPRRHKIGQQVYEMTLNFTIREMQVKPATRYHLVLVRMTIINLKSVGEDVQKKEPLYTAGGNVNWYRHHETAWNFLRKIKNRATI